MVKWTADVFSALMLIRHWVAHSSSWSICYCAQRVAKLRFLCEAKIAVSSANVAVVVLRWVGMSAVYRLYNIGPRTDPCGTLAEIGLRSVLVSSYWT